MSFVKNRSILYLILRDEFEDGYVVHTAVCCICKTVERAEELRGEYEQAMIDKGADKNQFSFYVIGNTFYDS